MKARARGELKRNTQMESRRQLRCMEIMSVMEEIKDAQGHRWRGKREKRKEEGRAYT